MQKRLHRAKVQPASCLAAFAGECGGSGAASPSGETGQLGVGDER